MTTAGCCSRPSDQEAQSPPRSAHRLLEGTSSRSIGLPRGSLAAQRARFTGDFVSPALGDAQLRAAPSASSAWRREETPSFRSRLFTCERTVCSEMKSRAAI